MTSRAYLLAAFALIVLIGLLSGCAIEPRTPSAYEKQAAIRSAEYDRIEAMRARAEECARQFSAFDLTKGCRYE